MSRIQQIEDLVAGTLPNYLNLKVMVRGRPRFLDPQLDTSGAFIRFAQKRGFNYTSIVPDNQSPLVEDAFRDSNRLIVRSRPAWFSVGALIRVGQNFNVGELHLIDDLRGDQEMQTVRPLLANYDSDPAAQIPTFVSLIGSPALFFAFTGNEARRELFVETHFQMVPGDTLLLSPTSDVLESFSEYTVTRADFLATRPGALGEPATLYRYLCEVDTTTGLIPFTPETNQKCFLKAHPLFLRDGFAVGNLKIPADVGPCCIDFFGGALQINNPVTTTMGLQLFDAFGQVVNGPANQEWIQSGDNFLLLERPIKSSSFLFWQRVAGKFQLKKGDDFQGEFDESGYFEMTSDLLVPQWPSDRQRGWVIPIISQAPCRISVQFEPQPPQVFDIPANQLTFIRPKILVDALKRPISRIVWSMQGSPASRVEIRTWEFDGPAVQTLSYYLLGTGAAFGEDKWIAGGVSLKPMFLNFDVLKARYSDGVSRYNAGYVYV